MTILVTGASGHLGRLAIEHLLDLGVAPDQIVAGARKPATLVDLTARGIQTARVDYTDAASLDAAFAGVDHLLLVSSSEVGQRAVQHAAVIDAAKRAGVEHLVYTSAPAATTSALILAPEHKATEEAIVASGIPATILRNGWYTENYAGTAKQAATIGELVASVGEGRVASASRTDYARAAAVVLTEPGHVGQVYELSGDYAWDFTELAAAISTALDTTVGYRSVTSEEHATILRGAGLDEGTIGFVVGLDTNIRDGLLAVTTGDLARLIQRPTTPLAEGLAAAL
jgi:NAD(P)H dehydrogenase (quinone)